MLTEQEIVISLTKIFKEIFYDESIIVKNDTNADDIEMWDSLTHMQLIDAIENKFNFKFTFNEVMNFNTVGDLINCIKNKNV